APDRVDHPEPIEHQKQGQNQRSRRHHYGAKDEIKKKLFSREIVFGKGVTGERTDQCATQRNRPGIKQRIAKPPDKNAAPVSKQINDVLKKMRWISKPKSERGEDLAAVFGYRSQHPDRGQDAVN